jgi:uncharacterized MAPEG superfamily protein
MAVPAEWKSEHCGARDVFLRSTPQDVVWAVALWIAQFFWAMNRQSATRRRVRAQFVSRLKKENGGVVVDLSKYGKAGSMSFMRNEPAIVNDPEFIRADRAFLNSVEQAAPFLASLALCALTASPWLAGVLGIAYALGRTLYYPLYHRPTLLLTLVTVPNYVEILVMLSASLYSTFLA